MATTKLRQLAHRSSRRTLLKFAGAAVTASIVAPLTGIRQALSRAAPRAAMSSDRIALLAPQMSYAAGAAERWMAGVQNGLKATRLLTPVEWLVERYGARPSVAVERADALIGQGGLQAVVAMIDTYAAGQLRQLCARHNVPLIISTLGANAARQCGEGECPGVAIQSLDMWQATAALGAWAAQALGPRAVVASAFYDSGYDLPFALGAGFESAGGTLAASFVSHRPTDSTDLSALMTSIRDAAPDVVLAAYCGAQAGEFVRAYDGAGLRGRAPLVTTSFMLDDAALGEQALGLYSGAAWAGDPFEMLGMRAAQRTVALLAERGRRVFIPAFRTDASASSPGAKSATPAGPDVYLRQVRLTPSGARNVVIEPIAPAVAARAVARVTEQLQAAPKTGWLYEYLCA